MKKILMITPRNPYPPVGGEKIKTFYAIKGLAAEFEVDLVVIDSIGDNEQSYDELRKIVKNLFVFKKSKISHYFAMAKGLWNALPLQANYYYFNDISSFIKERAGNYDLVYCNLIRTALYAKEVKGAKILDMVDSIGQNYKNSVSKTKSPFWKFIYWIESKRLLQFEKECINDFNKTLFVNPFERDYYAAPEKTEWTQLGVRDDLLSYDKTIKGYENSICFLGKMNYQPNVDAVIWFCENVLPLLPNFKFVIVGAEPSNAVLNLVEKYKNVQVTGFVDDPFLILNSSLAIVAPMQTGAGVQNKVLEGMALGKPVILSSLAAKAIIGAKTDEHFFVADEPTKIAELLQPDKRSHLAAVGVAARDFISKNYSWNTYGKNLAKLVSRMI